MPSVNLSFAARHDIHETSYYIAQRNQEAARYWRQEIRKVLSLLAEMSGLGVETHEFSVPARRFTKYVHKTAYVIFYEQTADGIMVLRILHHARDIKAQLN
jgi:plasmid stabilization system protein ParE